MIIKDIYNRPVKISLNQEGFDIYQILDNSGNIGITLSLKSGTPQENALNTINGMPFTDSDGSIIYGL